MAILNILNSLLSIYSLPVSMYLNFQIEFSSAPEHPSWYFFSGGESNWTNMLPGPQVSPTWRLEDE